MPPRALARASLRFVGGNEVVFYDCGAAAFPAMFEAIEGAQHSVAVEVYTLRSDRIGTRMRDCLVGRAREGVRVRVLYDAVGSHETDPAYFGPLHEAGVETLPFNPVFRSGRLSRSLRRRNHRKLWIVDGATVFTGGLNLGDEYDAPAVPTDGKRGWRDTQLRLRGPLVADYERVFERSWRSAQGELNLRTRSSRESPATEMPVRAALLADGSRLDKRRTGALLIGSLDAARSSARLASPYFAPSRKLLRALERAAQRGVRVEILTAGATDHPILRFSHRDTARSLLAAGVRLFEYAPAMMHAKSAVFDRRIAIVGSSNLDRQSLHHNLELNTVFDDANVAARVFSMIERDLTHATEITSEELDRRPFWQRIRDRLAAIGVALLI